MHNASDEMRYLVERVINSDNAHDALIAFRFLRDF